MEVSTILPDPAHLHLLGFVASPTRITAVVVTIAPSAPCPLRGQVSTHVHSRYVRAVQDLPWHGVALRLELHVWRFFCANPARRRQIFTERLPAVLAPYARRTLRLQAWFVAVGFAAGAEAGARLLAALGLTSSPDTLLRVLSVDDWSAQPGQRYGTLLADLERDCPVDLLADRSAETFATWLQEHPGVEIISRDRGGAYAEGARDGAPAALQVADRWHLLKNLGDALEQFLRRERVQLPLPEWPGSTTDTGRDAGAEDAESARGAPFQDPAHSDAVPRQLLQLETKHAATASPSPRQDRFTLVHARRQAGASIRAIALEFGMARNTVRRYLRANRCPDWRRGRRRTLLDRYQDYVLQHWNAGCHNGSQLFREIRMQGDRGGASQVGVFIARLREHLPATPALPPPPKPLSPRALRWLLARRPEALTDAERVHLHELLRAHADVLTAYDLVQRFGCMVRERRAGDLEAWLVDAAASGVPEVAGFVQGIQRDRAAVEAGLTLEWRQGQTEGQVNRLKLLKRAMYGRAKLDLLRQRVLHRNTI
jgi:transposase